MRTLNLGILAHVDAGKTSLTERLLYAAGIIDEIGSVDAGNTQTDTLELERQRGITIKAAVVSFAIADVTVNLIAPGTMRGDRINQLDVRVAKILDLAGTRTMLALDVYNAMNSSAVLTYNPAFVPGGSWLQPLTILTPRFVKITAELEF